jgi:hypothetical protein
MLLSRTLFPRVFGTSKHTYCFPRRVFCSVSDEKKRSFPSMGMHSRAEKERAFEKQRLDEASCTGVFTIAANFRQFLTRNGFDFRSEEEIFKDHGGRPLVIS